MSALPVRQVAYFAPDVRVAVLQHNEWFGSDPYFVADNNPLRSANHRGVKCVLDQSSAYGQWGEVMIEFVQQNNSGLSDFHVIHAEGWGRFGFHHIAIFVEDVNSICARYTADGFQTPFRAEMNDGFVYAFIDAVSEYVRVIELYAPEPQ